MNPNILLGVFLSNLILRPNKSLSSLEILRGNVSHNNDGETFMWNKIRDHKTIFSEAFQKECETGTYEILDNYQENF